MTTVNGNILDRTLSRLTSAWRGISQGRSRPLIDRLDGRLDQAALSRDDITLLRQAVDDCLQAKGGKVSARARAADLGRAYMAMNEANRLAFMTMLAKDYGSDKDAVDRAAAALARVTPAERRKAETEMAEVLRPRYIDLLKQFNGLPDGIKFLVDLRAALIRWSKAEPALSHLEADLKRLLAAWFDVGLLTLQPITWRSSAHLLERLIAYEAVHKIKGWTDLKNRLDSDRRCFAFFHPSMPDEPLIFVEVALVDGMVGNIQELLDEEAPAIDPHTADTAIFYSISNAQKGLAGISFGDFLIKRVVDLLGREFPDLNRFATLSPVPALRLWLRQCLPDIDDAILGRDDAVRISELLDQDWPHRREDVEPLRAPLMRLAAHYLSEARREGRVVDPVEHFHLTNGARLERLNWLGDNSSKGLRESLGMMVNYLYDLKTIENNHEAYSEHGKVAVSAAVRAHLKN